MTQTNDHIQAPHSDIFNDGARLLGAKARSAIAAIQTYVALARDVANDTNPERATSELADLRRQTEDAIETGRHLNPLIKDFAQAVRTYKIEPECIEAMFESLYMDTVNTSFTAAEYRKYVTGAGEAIALMILNVLCYKRAVLYHKLIPGGRALGAAICKVNLINDHGRTHKRHGRMYFPDVVKSTFNQARLAEVIVDIEADFRAARSVIPMLPPGTKTAVTLIYAYYYDLLQQMRKLTPAQIDAGQAQIPGYKKYYLMSLTYIAPHSALNRKTRH